MTYQHVSVLANELIEQMNLHPGSTVVDCTGGGGGHSSMIIELIGENGQLIIFDQDPVAVEHLTNKFESSPNVKVIPRKFSLLREELLRLKIEGGISAIIADLGVSSVHLDHSERGFSFRRDGPLDMRMDPKSNSLTAATILNEYDFKDIFRILKDFGDEPRAHAIAKAIIRQRETTQFHSTSQLGEFISGFYTRSKSKKHPATRVFQALRIAVNRELEELEALLSAAPRLLAQGGRLGIISFHSLEDRYIKHSFKRLADPLIDRPELKRLPLAPEEPEFTIIQPFPITPSEQEIANNPRARSAKLRVIQRTGS